MRMSLPLPPDPYQALRIPKDAETDVIRAAYRKLALKYNPDREKDETEKLKAQNQWQKVKEAYKLLGDPDKRSRNDDQVKRYSYIYEPYDPIFPKEYPKFYDASSPSSLYNSNEHVYYTPQRSDATPRRHSHKASYTMTKPGGWHSPAGHPSPRFYDIVGPDYMSPLHKSDVVNEQICNGQPQRSRATRRPSTFNRESSRKTKPKSTSHANVSRKATEEHAIAAGIPAGYSTKNWDPTEAPIILLGSTFDTNSLGKWIYDWTVYHHSASTPMADVASDLWLLLIQLGGKIKRAQDGGKTPTIIVDDRLDEDVPLFPYTDSARHRLPASRRGRGRRRNKMYLNSKKENADLNPFERECLFSDEEDAPKVPAIARLDSWGDMSFCMSMRYLKTLGKVYEMSTRFKDPNIDNRSGRMMRFQGIVRNMPFRIRGTSITFRKDFYVSDTLDDLVDVVFGWKFMASEFKLLFEKAGRMSDAARNMLSDYASPLMSPLREAAKLPGKIVGLAAEAGRQAMDYFNGGKSEPSPPYSLEDVGKLAAKVDPTLLQGPLEEVQPASATIKQIAPVTCKR